MFEQLPILIVEDEALVALSLSEAVRDFDGRVVGPVATVADALAMIDTRTIAAAILDAQLLDRDVTPVALRLAEAGVPFVIHSGTGMPDGLAGSLPEVPVLMKPMPATIVVACLANELRQPRGQQLLNPPTTDAGSLKRTL